MLSIGLVSTMFESGSSIVASLSRLPIRTKISKLNMMWDKNVRPSKLVSNAPLAALPRFPGGAFGHASFVLLQLKRRVQVATLAEIKQSSDELVIG